MDRKNKMINFTPISNDILIEIFAKGKLNQSEMRIALFIIRNSVGYSFNGSRQQWTKEFTVSEIAKAIEMHRPTCSETINRMVREGKLLRKGNQYQFNEHYENWKVYQNTGTKQSVSKRYGKRIKMIQGAYQNDTVSVSKRYTQPSKSADKNKAISHPKETINKNINKDNISKDISLKKEKSIKKKMTEEQNKHCFSLVMWFSKEILNIDAPDRLWIAREMKHAYRLLYKMNLPENVIKNICTWRIKDSFWRNKFHSLGSIATHFTDWMSEAKIKPLSFTDWLDNHPEEDYRKEQNKYVRASRYLIAFKRARRDNILFTSEEIRKNTVAIKMMKQETKKYLGGER